MAASLRTIFCNFGQSLRSRILAKHNPFQPALTTAGAIRAVPAAPPCCAIAGFAGCQETQFHILRNYLIRLISIQRVLFTQTHVCGREPHSDHPVFLDLFTLCGVSPDEAG